MTLPSWNGASTNGGGGGGEVTIAPAFLEQKLSIADILSGPQSIAMPAEFLKTPRIFLSFVFVDVSEVPVTPGDPNGLITFDVKTRANPVFAEAIKNGTNINATVTPVSLAFASPPTEIIVSGSDITVATDVIVRVSGSI